MLFGIAIIYFNGLKQTIILIVSLTYPQVSSNYNQGAGPDRTAVRGLPYKKIIINLHTSFRLEINKKKLFSEIKSCNSLIVFNWKHFSKLYRMIYS